MGARPGGHLGGAGRTCALGVALWVSLTLSSAPFPLAATDLPAPAETTGRASLRELPARPEPPSASMQLLALTDDPEHDPASEAVSTRFGCSLAPAELLRDAVTEEPLALPAAAPSPRGPPAGSRRRHDQAALWGAEPKRS
jgi:hypothetical protein